MSSWGGICICGAGCKRETGCRGYGGQYEMGMNKPATIISGIAPVSNCSEGTEKSFGADEEPKCKSAKCSVDPCSY